ncbi:MAG: metal-dependent transcriptional regulator [Bryobacterales bacterium]|nr:metal-dependent transcriptional regulator [Bryobacterales bacterium]
MAISTESTDNYLKAVFELTAVSERATTSEISRRLNVSAASVTGMLKKLASATPSLVTYEKRRGAELTATGERRAIEVIRHHRLIETYLHEALGYRWDEVHDEAEKLEHFISEELEDRMAAKLGYPEYDPHGHPIPRRNGTIPPCSDVPLSQIAEGTTIQVNRVPDHDPGLLQTLTRCGVGLYGEFTVVRQPGAQVATVLRKGNNTPFALDADIAHRLRVKIAGNGHTEGDRAARRGEKE